MAFGGRRRVALTGSDLIILLGNHADLIYEHAECRQQSRRTSLIDCTIEN